MIVGIAGSIASGKSTFGRALAKQCSANFVSFGDYVRYAACARGIDISDRAAVQELGQSLVAADARSFVLSVFAWANVAEQAHVVLDGVRHESVWKEILTFASEHGEAAKLIFLDVAEEERQRRLVARGLSREEAEGQDLHASESDVQFRLRAKADIRVDSQKHDPARLAAIGRDLGIR